MRIRSESKGRSFSPPPRGPPFRDARPWKFLRSPPQPRGSSRLRCVLASRGGGSSPRRGSAAATYCGSWETGSRPQESVVTALYLALRFWNAPYVDLIQFVTALGGDVDTIAAMAGAVWGAGHGRAELPAEPIARLEDAARLSALAADLHRRTATTA